jgi:hypothetical protein
MKVSNSERHRIAEAKVNTMRSAMSCTRTTLPSIPMARYEIIFEW